MSKSLLIIDDDEMVLDAVSSIFTELGYQVESFSDPIKGLKRALENPFDLVLSDLRMPTLDGAALTKILKEHYPQQKILILTAFPADPLAIQALEAGATGLMRKPFEIEKILKLIEA